MSRIGPRELTHVFDPVRGMTRCGMPRDQLDVARAGNATEVTCARCRRALRGGR